MLWESSKNQFGRPKKKGRQSFRFFLENLPTKRVPPLILFQKSVFGRPTQKIFLKAPLAPYILTLSGGARQKKRDFFVKRFQKLPKNGFFDYFFKKLPAAKNLAKIGAKQCFGRARKINLVDLKKKVVKDFDFF